ncbi:unnamed protein product [Absidia cylindrospora]
MAEMQADDINPDTTNDPITDNTKVVEDSMDVDTTTTEPSTISEEQLAAEKSLAALESLETIEEGLSQDKTNYELLTRRIEALKLADLPEQLEAAREAMHNVYPLTEKLWLEWIDNVKKEPSTEERDLKLRRLYQEADQDYLSIPIWQSYVEYIREKFDEEWALFDDKNDPAVQSLVETAREDLLKAVRATTYHIEKSHIIWNAYADFEVKLMEADKSAEQWDKLKHIYLNRLQVLHIACDETFSDYSQLNSAYDNNNYEANLVEANKIYATMKAAAEDRDYYEQYLKDEGYSLDAFYQYIENEKVAKKLYSLNQVRNLYERAVAIYATDMGLWNDYICFMMESAHVLAFLNPITLRAVRNCPWSGVLWSHLARFVESAGGSLDQVVDIYDRAVANEALLASIEDLVTVMLAKCSHARRQVKWDDDDEEGINYLRLTFQEALMYINDAFKTGDPYYRIEKYWATMEAKRLDNEDRAREIWDGVVKKRGRNSEAWLDYINFERSTGNIYRCTTLIKEALNKHLDYPERIMAVWQAMEYEEGSVESLEECFVKINKKSKILTREWQATLAQQEEREEKQAQKDILQKKKKSAHRRKQMEAKKAQNKDTTTTSTQPMKRKLSSTEGDDMDVDRETSKKPKLETTTDQQQSKDDNTFKVPASVPKTRGTGARGGGRGRGGRGGRGAFSGTYNKSSASAGSESKSTAAAAESVTPRSNDDFRAMLLAGRK